MDENLAFSLRVCRISTTSFIASYPWFSACLILTQNALTEVELELAHPNSCF